MHAAKHHWQSARDIVNEAARCWVPCHKVNPENPAAAAEALAGLVEACKRIAWARDWYADHDFYPTDGPRQDQRFDDWAADVASAAIALATGMGGVT